MTFRILLAALLTAAILSGCSLPAPASPEAPAAPSQAVPTLEPATPPPAPLAPTTQTTPEVPPVPGISHSQQVAPSPSDTSVVPPVSSSLPVSETAVPTQVQPTATSEGPPQPAMAAAAAIEPFSSERAWKHVRQLAVEVGSRPSDSDAQRRAAEYIRDQFASMGYGAELDPYSFAQFRENAARLEVQEPLDLEIEARAIVYSGDGSSLGQLTFVGLGRPSDLPEGGLQGNIALIERGQITFEEKVANAIAVGAGGVIVYNNQPGAFPAALRTPATIPAVAIAQADGQELRDLLRQGPVVARVAVEASSEAVDGRNVVASGPVATDRETVVIGAHYDSVETGPGANDNASGVATMLEIARVIQDRNYPFDVVFVAFGDEEIGLIGSKRYVQALSQSQRDQIVAMINLDMVGVGDRIQFGGTDWLASLALESARREGHIGSQLDLPSGTSSDHASFISAGVPSVFFYRPDDPYYHTAEDTAQKVLPEMLGATGQIALELLDQLSRRA